MFKVLSQQLRGTLTMTFERHLTVADITAWINIRANFFLGIKYYETKMVEGAWEVISWTKIGAYFSKNIASRYFTFYCILLFPSNKPSF